MKDVLQCSTSLWSADLANLASEIRRVEPYSDRFHLDVCDGSYLPLLLFFPDLVEAIRPHTELPFEVHLMTKEPLKWIQPFVDAGADRILLQFDTLMDPASTIHAVHSAGAQCGLALGLDDPVDAIDRYWARLDLVTVVGTLLGVKGSELDPRVPQKVRRARVEVSSRGLATEIQVDGGIRRHTVPLLHEAGAHSIVPGSLMFGGDPAELRRWLATL